MSFLWILFLFSSNNNNLFLTSIENLHTKLQKTINNEGDFIIDYKIKTRKNFNSSNLTTLISNLHDSIIKLKKKKNIFIN